MQAWRRAQYEAATLDAVGDGSLVIPWFEVSIEETGGNLRDFNTGPNRGWPLGSVPDLRVRFGNTLPLLAHAVANGSTSINLFKLTELDDN